jgi:hypothetical protein
MINRNEGMFTGTIDQLLTHCDTLDVEQIEQDIVERNKQECIEYIMKDMECSVEEAEFIYNEINLEETRKAIESLMAEGLVKIVGHNEDGEPLYASTQKDEKPKKVKRKKK